MADTLQLRTALGRRDVPWSFTCPRRPPHDSTAAVPVGAGPAAGNLLQAQPEAPAYPGLDDPDPAVRAEDASRLCGQPTIRRAVPALIAHLEDPDQRTGLYIAQALVELATREQITPLLLLTGRGKCRWPLARGVSCWASARTARDPVAGARAARPGGAGRHARPRKRWRISAATASIRALDRSLYSPRPSEVHAAMRGLLTLGDAAVPELQAAVESGNREAEKSAAIVLEAIVSATGAYRGMTCCRTSTC